MIIRGQSQAKRGSQRIKVSIKDKPFWAEAGTNFDLLDNIKTNNFYAGIYMFDKDIGRIKPIRSIDHLFKKKDSTEDKSNNLSFTGGVYESQSVSTRSTASSGIAYRDINTVHRDTGSVNATTSVKSIGILFSPHLRLTNGKTDANGYHMFLSFYSEILWQTVKSSFDYSKLGKDSIIAVANRPMDISKYPYKESTVSYDFRSHYMGLGFPVYIKENEFNLYLNNVIGITSQKFYVHNYKPNQNDFINPLSTNYISDLTFLSPNVNWNAFFLFQFRLNEVAYGITFSGEIRGLILQNAKPVITLAISKKFDLSAFFKPFLSTDK
jgi:hypothetical protein